MPRTRLSRTRKIVGGATLDVRFGAELIFIDEDSPTTRNVARVVEPTKTWLDSLVGLFDNSPTYAEVLRYEQEARKRMDEEVFVMPE